MKWSVIIKYALILFAATFVGGMIPGIISGIYAASSLEAPTWVSILQGILVPLFALFVYVRLARDQRNRVVAHVCAVWALGSLVSLGNLAIGQSLFAWAGGLTIHALVAIVGAVVGNRLGPLNVARDTQ